MSYIYDAYWFLLLFHEIGDVEVLQDHPLHTVAVGLRIVRLDLLEVLVIRYVDLDYVWYLILSLEILNVRFEDF